MCTLGEYSVESIDGLELRFDNHPETLDYTDDLAFHIYLLGHDSAAKHNIKFIRMDDSEYFNIFWSGNIALAYKGDYEYKHEFTVMLSEVKFPDIST